MKNLSITMIIILFLISLLACGLLILTMAGFGNKDAIEIVNFFAPESHHMIITSDGKGIFKRSIDDIESSIKVLETECDLIVPGGKYIISYTNRDEFLISYHLPDGTALFGPVIINGDELREYAAREIKQKNFRKKVNKLFEKLQ